MTKVWPVWTSVYFYYDAQQVAKKKMQYLIHQGLFRYFSHKVDEYGVYFFDPLYYESTEPFHANLRLVTNSFGTHWSKLIYSYFKLYKYGCLVVYFYRWCLSKPGTLIGPDSF